MKYTQKKIAGEFDLIDIISDMFSDTNINNIVGIGDDCAIIPCDDDVIVISTDMLVEDIHFIKEATSANDLGAKSLLVNLSDVAAMGVKPIFSLLSISIPPECRGEWIIDFMRGYHTISKQFGVMLIGGDTTGAKDKICINVVAIGRGDGANIKKRCDAKVGDRVFVSGVLGQSAAGLRDILNNKYDTIDAIAHKKPTIALNEGVWLGSREHVHAMMDISDGIASDIKHILKNSNVSANIEISKIPTSSTIEDAVCGGEDYKLLFTVAPEHAQEIKDDFQSRFKSELYDIGEIIESQNNRVVWLENNTEVEPNWCGFRHF